MIKTLKKINSLISDSDILLYSVEEQKVFLKSFENPRDLIENSYYQYLCHNKMKKKRNIFLCNLLSAVGIVPILAKCCIGKKKVNDDSKAYVYSQEFVGRTDLLPKDLKEDFASAYNLDCFEGKLCKEDLKFIFKLMARYPWSFYFNIKCIIKIAQYSQAIACTKVKKIVVCNEYSFTSSVLTQYCRNNRVEHINLTHGERIFELRSAFSTYDKFYIWDEHYIDIYNQLRAGTENYIVEIPDTLKIGHDLTGKVPITVDYKFYLQLQEKDALIEISNIIDILIKEGYVVKVRPHPLTQNWSCINDVFDIRVLEDLNNISIEKSILETKSIVSGYSTVLNQAYCAEKEIVIDDITNKKMFEYLKEADYIMLKKPHKLLSALINETIYKYE